MMEIISYLKGKKAQNELQSLREVIGEDQFKSGPLDVSGNYQDVSSRIAALEAKHANDKVAQSLNDLTALVTRQINRSLLSTRIIRKANYNDFNNVIVDDLSDLSGIDQVKSTNLKFTTSGGVISQSNRRQVAVAHLKPISSKEPIQFIVFEMALSKNQPSTEIVPIIMNAIEREADGYYKSGYEIIVKDFIKVNEEYVLNQLSLQGLITNNGSSIEALLNIDGSYIPIHLINGQAITGSHDLKLVIKTGQSVAVKRADVDSFDELTEVRGSGVISVKTKDAVPVVRQPKITHLEGTLVRDRIDEKLTNTLASVLKVRKFVKTKEKEKEDTREIIKTGSRLISIEKNDRLFHSPFVLVGIRKKFQPGGIK